VIFAPGQILKADGRPYTVYTPFARRWREGLEKNDFRLKALESGRMWSRFIKVNIPFPEREELGFLPGMMKVRGVNWAGIRDYHENRDFPSRDGGTNLGPQLRFGTVSVRKAAAVARERNTVLLGELIWREFFIHILYYFPWTAKENFKSAYNVLPWREDEGDFQLWKEGRTGYSLVDAGMRELNESGRMHNRVRMLTASFLSKHLLLDWRLGEAYFARKLLDYEMASNVGNWQWAAGSGCDAQPWFRIFNPQTQQLKFDKAYDYVKRWVPEYGTKDYPRPMIGHSEARERALEVFRTALKSGE